MLVEPERVEWRRLDYKASKLGMSTTFRIERERLSADAARKRLVDPTGARKGLEPTGPTESLELSTTFLGRDSRSTLLFSPRDATTYQREVVETGSRSRFKVVRFAPESIVVRRREPASPAEEKQHPSTWSSLDEEIVRYPAGTDRVLEPGVLLYLVSALDLEDGADRTMTFFTHGEVHRARVEVDGLHQMDVAFDVVGSKGLERVNGPRVLRKLTVTPETLGGRQGKLEFLGLEGAIEIFVDLEHDTAVLIRGKVKIAGEVEVWLQRVQLS